MHARHPKASLVVLEHLVGLIVFLDIFIKSGFSYGSAKAFICVISGKVLGRVVGRFGVTCEPERVQAIVEFADDLRFSFQHAASKKTLWQRRRCKINSKPFWDRRLCAMAISF